MSAPKSNSCLYLHLSSLRYPEFIHTSVYICIWLAVLAGFLLWFKRPGQDPARLAASARTRANLFNVFNIIRRSQGTVDVCKTRSGFGNDTPVIQCRMKQPYDALLVLDVEATCLQGIPCFLLHLCISLTISYSGSGLNWPNEIIEWPVCLMRWMDRSEDGKVSQLKIVDEYRSFVRPSWRPELSAFCTELTGITQAQVNSAPLFPDVLQSFSKFLAKNGLIHPKTGQRLVRFCWCSDGPFDIQGFVVKQCFLSKIAMPEWLKGDVIDIRKIAASVTQSKRHQKAKPSGRRSLNIPLQLRALGLSQFEGREHSGIDDARNVARIAAELARKGSRLEANTVIYPGRRWHWMGKPGEVLED